MVFVLSTITVQSISAVDYSTVSQSAIVSDENIIDFVSVPGTTFTMGQLVRHNGNIYRVLQTFTYWGDPNWHPGGAAHSLWEFVSVAGSTPTQPPTEPPSTTNPTPDGSIIDFISIPGTTFTMGQLVRHNGNVFRVLQSFTYWGDPNWHPGGAAHSLWQLVTSNGGGETPVEPDPNPSPQLTIVTNERGSVFTETDVFIPGDVITLVVIPDIGYYLATAVASTGQLVTTNHISFTFTMPAADTTLTFTFNPTQPMTGAWFNHRPPILTFREPGIDDIMTSTIFDNFMFVRGELVAIGSQFATYRQIEELVYYHGGEIVGFLEVPNVYQIYFTDADEVALHGLAEIFNQSELVTLAVLNVAGEGFGDSLSELPPPTIPNDARWAEYWDRFAYGEIIGGVTYDGQNIQGNWGMVAINAPYAWGEIENIREISALSEYVSVSRPFEIIKRGANFVEVVHGGSLSPILFDDFLQEHNGIWVLDPWVGEDVSSSFLFNFVEQDVDEIIALLTNSLNNFVRNRSSSMTVLRSAADSRVTILFYPRFYLAIYQLAINLIEEHDGVWSRHPFDGENFREEFAIRFPHSTEEEVQQFARMFLDLFNNIKDKENMNEITPVNIGIMDAFFIGDFLPYFIPNDARWADYWDRFTYREIIGGRNQSDENLTGNWGMVAINAPYAWAEIERLRSLSVTSKPTNPNINVTILGDSIWVTETPRLLLETYNLAESIRAAHDGRWTIYPFGEPVRNDFIMHFPNFTEREMAEIAVMFAGGNINDFLQHNEPVTSDKSREITPINIGIFDGFFVTHEDIHDLTFLSNDVPREWIGNPYFDFVLMLDALSLDIHHGLHVAGIIGATTNNNLGVSGLVQDRHLYTYSTRSAYARDFEFMTPLYNHIMRYKHGIATLFANDVRVINFSQGFGNPPQYAGFDFFDIYASGNESHLLIRNAMAELLLAYYNLGKDFLVVESAGNYSHSTLGLPTGSDARNWVHAGYRRVFGNITNCERYAPIYDRIIVVGNMELREVLETETNEKTYGIFETSQIGDRVDIFAPGTAIYSTSFPRSGLNQPLESNVDFEGLGVDQLSEVVSRFYYFDTGTSMAAPHVTGVAGLIWNVRPDLSGAQVKDIILNNTLRHDNDALPLPTNVRVLDENRGADGRFQIFGEYNENQNFRPGPFNVLCAASAVRYAINFQSEGEAAGYINYKMIFGSVRLSEDEQSTQTDISGLTSMYAYNVETSEWTFIPIRYENDRWNMFEIMLPRTIHHLYISMDGRRTEIRTLDLTAPVPFQMIELAEGRSITVYFQDERITTPPFTHNMIPEPILVGGRTLVPIAPIVEALDFTIDWGNQEIQEIMIGHDGHYRIRITMDDPRFYIIPDDFTDYISYDYFLDNIPPQIIDGHPFMPVRSIVEALGFEIETQWDDEYLRIFIISSLLRFGIYTTDTVERIIVGGTKWR